MENKFNSQLEERFKKIPLKTRLNILNQTTFISLLSELGYRGNKIWTDEEDDKFDKLIELANKHTEDILEEISEWIEDGEPTE